MISHNAKQVYSFIPYFWSPHLETDLELIKRHVAAQDDVTVFVCGGELPTCFSNTTHDLDVCKLCINRRRNGFELTGLHEHVTVKSFLNLSFSDQLIYQRFRDLQLTSIDELLGVTIDGCPIGKNIFNEMSSLHSEDNFSFAEHQLFIRNALDASVLVYLSFKNHFTENKPDIFYTFNGRFVVIQPAIAAAIATGTDYAVHDRAGVLNRYTLVPNERFHSLKYWTNAIESCWSSSCCPESYKRRVGAEWFVARMEGQAQGWFSFTSEQMPVLPDNFNKQMDNIVIFISSNWEFVGMDDYGFSCYSDQNDGLLKVANGLKELANTRIFVRVHPHLKDKQNSQTSFIAEQLVNKFSNLTVVPADSKISSYELMKNADLVITFGSTTGVEAAYLKVPSLLLGRAWYETIGVCDQPRSHEEVIGYLIDKKYKLSDQELHTRYLNSLKYGFFNQEGGRSFEFFKQTDIFDVHYLGSELGAISYDPPSYESGIKRELARRGELHGSPLPHPLTSITNELEHVADSAMAENYKLKRKLALLEASSAELAEAYDKSSALLIDQNSALRYQLESVEKALPEEDSSTLKRLRSQAARVLVKLFGRSSDH